MLKVNRQIKQLLSQSDAEIYEDLNSNNKDWDIPILEYIFPKWAWLVENFYGPEAEYFNVDKLLAWCIQVTKDIVTLLKLCKPSQ